VKNKGWSDEILSLASIDKAILGELVPSGTCVGRVDEGIAKRAKLPANVMLLAGGHDQPCAALGAGVIRGGIALDGMGSNECIVPAFSTPMINEKMRRSNLVCVPHIGPSTYVTYAFNRTAGSLFKWYARLLGGEGYDALLDAMPDAPTDLFVLPHFAGAATPYMDDTATGAVLGLKLSTTSEELTRAVIEGLSFEMLVNITCLKEAGFTVETLYASGGLSKNDRVLQIKADVLGIPVVRLANAETGTVGTAILGAMATGAYTAFEEAVATLVKTEKTFFPDSQKHKIYLKKFEKYKKIYQKVKEALQ
jgi:xylulokinase